MKHLQLMKCRLWTTSELFFWTSCIILLKNQSVICDKQNPLVSLPVGGDGIIAAFADFNYDRLTDVLMISHDQHSFHVLLQDKDEAATDKIGDKILSKNFSCSLTNLSRPINDKIVSLIPGDFDGDTLIDIAVITLGREDSHKEIYDVRMVSKVNWSCDSLYRTHFSSQSEPFMLDFNGDMICDFLASRDDLRLVYLGDNYTSEAGSKHYFMKPITFSRGLPAISVPHSNAFVDVNRDNLVDIVITTEEGIEYWYGHVNGTYGRYDGYKYEPSVTAMYFGINEGNDEKKEKEYEVGQSVFMDINRDGKIEHIIPVEGDVPSIRILRKTIHHHFSVICNLTSMNASYHFYKPDNFNLPLAMRVGDIDNDGYPDLLTILYKKPSNVFGETSYFLEKPKPFVALLHNEQDDSSPVDRTFRLKEDFLIGVSDPIIAGFFDFSENGKLDLIISAGNETNSRLLVRENSEVIEANFLKIIMSSGRCPPDGCDRNTGWMWSLRDVEGYSSNIPGAQVTYLMDDINGVKRAATSGQLKQSSHFALETPYMLFGLGELANYVEALNITLPSPQNNEDEKGLLHTMEQIIPDAHIIIVPRPLNEAKNWKAKLYFTVGDRIKRTVYTLLAICAALVLVIAVLHKKELREDAPEAKEFRQNWLDRR